MELLIAATDPVCVDITSPYKQRYEWQREEKEQHRCVLHESLDDESSSRDREFGEDHDETDEEKIHLLSLERGTRSYNPAKRHEDMGKIQWECEEEEAKGVHIIFGAYRIRGRTLLTQTGQVVCF
jgi:hypothetical protein